MEQSMEMKIENGVITTIKIPVGALEEINAAAIKLHVKKDNLLKQFIYDHSDGLHLDKNKMFAEDLHIIPIENITE